MASNNRLGAVKAFMAVSSLSLVFVLLGSHYIADMVIKDPSKMPSSYPCCSRENCCAADNRSYGKEKILMFPLRMDSDRIKQEHLQRKDILNRVCKSKVNLVGNSQQLNKRRFIFDRGHHLLYCSIEKVGSSFWKRVFAVLKGQQRNVSVFSLSGVDVHKNGTSYDTVKSSPFELQHFYVPSYTKFLFVRDPYERLFSGYIDKIFAPSYQTKRESAIMRTYFGKSLQTVKPTENVILKTERKLSEEGESALLRTPGVQTRSPSCHTWASFSEFCRYLTNDVDINVNSHFTAMHAKCSPCHIDYEIIGKMETFQDDVNYILTSAGVNATVVLGDELSFQSDNDLSIIRDVAMRAFDVIARDKGRCLGKVKMLRRTWTTFQIRGYLSIRIKFPVSDDEAERLTAEEFIELARQAYRNSGSREECKRQRKVAMLEAFYSIPRTLLKKVESFVEKDCKLFGYVCDVDQRFPKAQRPLPMFHFDSLIQK